MRPLHTRQPRPKLTDAHAIKSGEIYWVGHYITDTERMKIYDEFEKELLQILQKHFPKTKNLEYAIIKTHLIVEYLLTQYIRCTSYQLVELESIRFTFSQKLEIAFLHGFGTGDPFILPSVELLNKVRNQVAHRFSFDIQNVNELIQLNHLSDKDVKINKFTDRQRIACLRRWCNSLCGHMIGRLKIAILLSSNGFDPKEGQTSPSQGKPTKQKTPPGSP